MGPCCSLSATLEMGFCISRKNNLGSLNETFRRLATETKIDKWDYIKPKGLCASTDAVTTVSKAAHRMGGAACRFIARAYEELLQLTTEEPQMFDLKMTKDWNSHSPKMIFKQVHEQTLGITDHRRNADKTTPMHPLTPVLFCPVCATAKQRRSASGDVESLEPLRTARGNRRLCWFLKDVQVGLPHGAAVLLLGVGPESRKQGLLRDGCPPTLRAASLLTARRRRHPKCSPRTDG